MCERERDAKGENDGKGVFKESFDSTDGPIAEACRASIDNRGGQRKSLPRE